MSTKPNALWPWSPIVATLLVLNTAYPLQAFQDDWRDRQMETPIGDENGSKVERGTHHGQDG